VTFFNMLSCVVCCQRLNGQILGVTRQAGSCSASALAGKHVHQASFDVCRVRRFIKAALGAAGGAALAACTLATRGALAAALQRQMHALDASLLELQSNWPPPAQPAAERCSRTASHATPSATPSAAAAKSAAGADAAAPTLLRLEAATVGVAARLRLLDTAVAAAAAAAQNASSSAAEAAALTVDGLADLLAALLLRGGPQGTLATLKPSAIACRAIFV